MNNLYQIIPFVIIPVIIYIIILGGIFLLIFFWVNKFIKLRQEQNNLLREIIHKMDKNGTAVNP